MFSIRNLLFKDILDIGSLDFAKGRSTAVTGESGTGKTTLLKLMDGLYRPDSGSISYGGTDISAISGLRRRVTMISQQAVAYEGDIRYNLRLGRTFAGMSELDDSRLEDFLSCASLHLPLEHDTKMLSGGELSRLAIARALTLESETYLIDEPTSALDEHTQSDVIGCLLGRMATQGSTVIMVTHSPEAARMCDHNVHLQKGGAMEWIR